MVKKECAILHFCNFSAAVATPHHHLTSIQKQFLGEEGSPVSVSHDAALDNVHSSLPLR